MTLETERLRLRFLTEDDADFIVKLLNDPSFIANIGDKEVRTGEDARRYIVDGPLASYEAHGFGLLAVESLDGGEAMGMCGLVRRPRLDYPDLGYAFLPQFWGKGYAFEAAGAVLNECGLDRVLAVAFPANQPSIRLLKKLGFAPCGEIDLGPARETSILFEWKRTV